MIEVPIGIAALSWLTFCVWYGIRASWWKSSVGRNTMITSVLLALIFTRLTLLTLWPQLRSDLLVTGLAVYLGAAALGIHRIVLLERAQRAPDRRNGDRRSGVDRRGTTN